MSTLGTTDQEWEYPSGRHAVKYTRDPIIPLYKVSFTGLPYRSGPRLFGGTIGVFTKEISKISYFFSSIGKEYPDGFHPCNWCKGSESSVMDTVVSGLFPDVTPPNSDSSGMVTIGVRRHGIKYKK
ncbi:hypothetical protein Tco_1571340 [Tanacetum coccineum]